MTSIKQIYAVAVVTAQEILRDKILYNTLIFAILLIALGFLASNLTFIQPLRVLINSGVTGIALSLAVLGILLGAHSLNREFERRTILVALSRPVSSGQFLFGKFVGLAAVLAINWILLSLSLVLSVHLLFGGGEDVGAYFSTAFWVGLVLVYLQCLMVTSLSMMFSTLSTTSVSAIITAGFFLVGSNMSTLVGLGKTVKGDVEKLVVEWMVRLLPNFEFFNLGFGVTYGLPIDTRLLGTALIYWVAWVVGALAVGSVLIATKEST
jgi:ABC-type transport system involved in multi-copper enzyme maturation permease subunit